MGQAKNRGSYEERLKAAQERQRAYASRPLTTTNPEASKKARLALLLGGASLGAFLIPKR